MHATHNTLSENIRTQTAEILNRRLAAAIDLRGQSKQADWNVRGPTFIAVHELFDKIGGEAESYSDLPAERAASLGAVAESTVQVAAERPLPRPLSPQHRRRKGAHICRCGDARGVRALGPRGDRTVSDNWRRRHGGPLHRDFARRRSSALAGRIAGCSEMSSTADIAKARPENSDRARKIISGRRREGIR